jgi:hypothetical protein
VTGAALIAASVEKSVKKKKKEAEADWRRADGSSVFGICLPLAIYLCRYVHHLNILIKSRGFFYALVSQGLREPQRQDRGTAFDVLFDFPLDMAKNGHEKLSSQDSPSRKCWGLLSDDEKRA